MSADARAARAARAELIGLACEPWAIAPAWGEELLRIYLGEGEGPAALAARMGTPVKGTRRLEMQGSIAVLPVHGPIVRRAGLMADVSGLTSTDALRQDLEHALQAPDVAGILLDIDSPGGQASGIGELASAIRAAGDVKPVVAYVGNTGASAGYWLAAAAPRLVAHETASLGSIGVLISIADKAAPGEYRIVSTVSPDKVPDLSSKDGRATVLRWVDDLAAIFVEQVASFRGVDVATVTEQFGKGWVLRGRQALEVGMIDELGTFEAVLASMQQQSTLAGSMGRPAATRGTTLANPAGTAAAPDLSTLTAAQLEAGNPGLVAQLREAARSDGHQAGRREGLEAGRAEGATAERERILGIQEAALPGHDELVATLIRDPAVSAGEAALRINRAERQRGPDTLAARRQAEAQLPAVGSGATVQPVAGQAGAAAVNPDAPLEERCQAEWDADPKLRSEFGELAAFVAYKRQEEAGRVRIKDGRA